jgi:hypothetical protein
MKAEVSAGGCRVALAEHSTGRFHPGNLPDPRQ